MKIGITERGDAGLDLSWYDRLYDRSDIDGVILITKQITPDFMLRALELHGSGYPIIVHCTCTGWGGSPTEPLVPRYECQIDSLRILINSGFPIENCVLRIDPIIPTDNGLKVAWAVLTYAYQCELIPKIRVRMSILDEYKHVKQRLAAMGYHSYYPGDTFYASREQMENVVSMFKAFMFTNDVQFPVETCAEPLLCAFGKQVFVKQGCLSDKDLEIMKLPIPENMGINGQQRNGCQCLNCKVELLSGKKRCPHQCVYCFWKD